MRVHPLAFFVPALLFICVLSLALGRCESSPTPGMKLLRIERVHVDEPLTFRAAGKPIPEKELILLLVQVSDVDFYEPKDRMPDSLMLGGIVTQMLSAPIWQPTIVLACPINTPQAMDEIWPLPAYPAHETLTLEQLRAAHAHWTKYMGAGLVIPPALLKTQLSKPARTFTDYTALRRFAMELGKIADQN